MNMKINKIFSGHIFSLNFSKWIHSIRPTADNPSHHVSPIYGYVIKEGYATLYMHDQNCTPKLHLPNANPKSILCPPRGGGRQVCT